MKKITYAPEALEDLKGIKASVIENFGDEELAKKCVRELLARINDLGVFPYMGRELEKSTGIPTDYYYFFLRPNYVFYRIEEDSIRVIAVLNEKQDYLRTLFGICETDKNGT